MYNGFNRITDNEVPVDLLISTGQTKFFELNQKEEAISHASEIRSYYYPCFIDVVKKDENGAAIDSYREHVGYCVPK